MATMITDIEVLNRLYFGNTVGQYFLALGIFLLFLLIARVLQHMMSRFFIRIAEKTKNKVDDVVLRSMEKPIVFLTAILGLYFASFALVMPDWLRIWYGTGLRLLLTVDFAWLLISFSDALIAEFLEPLTKKTKSDLDDHLLPFLKTSSKTLIIIVVTIIALSELGFDVTAVIASLGIGGIAIGLAAKDFASNLFGGLVLILDRPFKLGDMIEIGGDKGKVRNITLRFTELETAEKTKKIIPNAKFVGTTIHNVSYRYR